MDEMITNTYRRKIDCRHRISIPAEIMHDLNIRDGDTCEFTYDANGIHLKKIVKCCMSCGSAKVEHEAMGLHLCDTCMKTIVSAYGESYTDGTF